MPAYKHLFFDLDHTLWDFDANAKESLLELYDFFNLKEKGLAKNKLVCFATDDVYNNWDCAVYSPKDGRFLLWFQQAHAD